MHMLSDVSKKIRRIDLQDNFSTAVSELWYKENIQVSSDTSHRVQYEEQQLWYNDTHTGISYMVQTLEHLAVSGI